MCQVDYCCCAVLYSIQSVGQSEQNKYSPYCCNHCCYYYSVYPGVYSSSAAGIKVSKMCVACTTGGSVSPLINDATYMTNIRDRNIMCGMCMIHISYVTVL